MRLGIMPDILSQHIFQGIINKGIPKYRFCVRLESDRRKLMTNIDSIVAGAWIWGCKVRGGCWRRWGRWILGLYG